MHEIARSRGDDIVSVDAAHLIPLLTLYKDTIIIIEILLSTSKCVT